MQSWWSKKSATPEVKQDQLEEKQAGGRGNWLRVKLLSGVPVNWDPSWACWRPLLNHNKQWRPSFKNQLVVCLYESLQVIRSSGHNCSPGICDLYGACSSKDCFVLHYWTTLWSRICCFSWSIKKNYKKVFDFIEHKGSIASSGIMTCLRIKD